MPEAAIWYLYQTNVSEVLLAPKTFQILKKSAEQIKHFFLNQKDDYVYIIHIKLGLNQTDDYVFLVDDQNNEV